MAYDNIPAENAPALPPRVDEYTFTVDLDGFHPDGNPRATIDDLALFDAKGTVGNIEMLDFLDRVVTRVELRGVPLVTRAADGAEQLEGVRGKNVPFRALRRIFAAVGEAMKDANNPGN